MVMAMLVPPMSLALGASKLQAVPNSTVLLALQVIAGAVVSATITVWLHRLKLPQASVACQVRVASKVLPQWPLVLVTVVTIAMVMLVPPRSLAVGESNVQAVPISTVLALPQLMTGPVVSSTLTFWLHCALLPQGSVTAQVRVASKVPSHWPAVFVVVPSTTTG